MTHRNTFLHLLFVFGSIISSGSATICTAKADVCLIIDESGSISNSEFNLVKSFITQVVQNITVSSEHTQISLITYSSTTRIKFHLNQYNSTEDVLTGVAALSNVGGSTKTGQALDLMDTTMFTSSNGDRADAPNIAILVTDGYSTNPPNTITQANQARANGQFIFAIGVAGAKQSELQAIANDPDELYVFNIAAFDYLADVASKILPKACAIAMTGGDIVGISCTNDTDCSSRIQNTACDSQSTCQCDPSYYVYDWNSLLCRHRYVGDACSADYDCSMTANSTCVSNFCSCQPPYASYETSCQFCKLGEYCPRNINCSVAIPYSSCIDGVMSCSAGYVTAYDAISCRVMILNEDSCVSSSQCTNGADCVNNVCVCGIAYTTSSDNTYCIARPLGSTCSQTAECVGISNGVCGSDQVCECGQGYIQGGSECRARIIGEQCVEDADCSGIKGAAVCPSVQATCQCDRGYIYVDTAYCRPRGLGEACNVTEDCGLALSYCSQGTCACQPGVPVENSMCVALGSSTGQNDTGAIVGGVLGCLAALGVACGIGVAVAQISANTAYVAKAVDAMRVQTQLTCQNVENMFPGMTPGTCNAVCSAAPISTRCCGS